VGEFAGGVGVDGCGGAEAADLTRVVGGGSVTEERVGVHHQPELTIPTPRWCRRPSRLFRDRNPSRGRC
jgi:hypothetical protein